MPRPPAPEIKPVSTKGPSGALIGGVVVLVVALIGALVFWAATRGDGGADASGTANALPDGGGVSVGPGTDADVPQLHVYGDPQCPWCGVLENSIGGAVDELVSAGEVNLTVTLMSFLDGRIQGENSARAANAALLLGHVVGVEGVGEGLADPHVVEGRLQHVHDRTVRLVARVEVGHEGVARLLDLLAAGVSAA